MEITYRVRKLPGRDLYEYAIQVDGQRSPFGSSPLYDSPERAEAKAIEEVAWTARMLTRRPV